MRDAFLSWLFLVAQGSDDLPWSAACTSIFHSLMVAMAFSRTISLMSKRSSPSTQVTKYCLNLVGFCLHIPSNWLQTRRRYDGRNPCHQRILRKALTGIPGKSES